MGVSKKIEGNTPKMDGENHGKPYFLMDDLGGKTHYFWKKGNTKLIISLCVDLHIVDTPLEN